MIYREALGGIMKYLYVRGTIVWISPDPAGGGAATMQIRLDSFHDRNRTVNSFENERTINFFCPSYRPPEVGHGDIVWIHLWLLTGSADISIGARSDRWVRPLNTNPDNYGYSGYG